MTRSYFSTRIAKVPVRALEKYKARGRGNHSLISNHPPTQPSNNADSTRNYRKALHSPSIRMPHGLVPRIRIRLSISVLNLAPLPYNDPQCTDSEEPTAQS